MIKADLAKAFALATLSSFFLIQAGHSAGPPADARTEVDRQALRQRIIESASKPSASPNSPAGDTFVTGGVDAIDPVEPERDDLAQDLVDELRYTRLQDMEGAGLTEAALPQSPWSDSYWPIYHGTIATRYADPGFPASLDFQENFDFLSPKIGRGELEHFSPAEKYDLLIGDREFTLTHKMLEDGSRIYDRDGKVEPWMGICHGWAPASFMAPRARNAVRALAADGRTWIPFLPSDIKALTSLLWANTQYPTRFIGRRCNTRGPERRQCLDTNPGTWHLSLINQIGVSKRSLIMDTSYDYEVWNQPVISYQYRYFNPKTREASEELAPARIARDAYAEDPYREFRSPQATHLVGISMEVTYIVETQPSMALTDSEEADSSASAHYEYDLELDASGAIVGGEWHSRSHPDFLWTPAPEAQARTRGDWVLDHQGDSGRWDPRSPVPAPWRRVARKGSEQSQPLARIVEGLLQASRAGTVLAQ